MVNIEAMLVNIQVMPANTVAKTLVILVNNKVNNLRIRMMLSGTNGVRLMETAARCHTLHIV